jgi:hypothetical protein
MNAEGAKKSAENAEKGLQYIFSSEEFFSAISVNVIGDLCVLRFFRQAASAMHPASLREICLAGRNSTAEG